MTYFFHYFSVYINRRDSDDDAAGFFFSLAPYLSVYLVWISTSHLKSAVRSRGSSVSQVLY